MEKNIATIKKIIKVLDKVKGVAFLTAVVMLLFIFIGGKIWAGVEWFVEAEAYGYIVLFIALVLVVLINVFKVLLAWIHNTIVRKTMADEANKA